MNFNGINVASADMEEIKEMELAHVATALLSLAETKRLCSLVGREVLAEYQFKGNFDEVVRQLNEYSLNVEAVGLDKDDRQDIIMRKLRLVIHRDQMEDTVEYQAILEAVLAGDRDKVTEMADQAVLLANVAHEQKMCECFTNSV